MTLSAIHARPPLLARTALCSVHTILQTLVVVVMEKAKKQDLPPFVFFNVIVQKLTAKFFPQPTTGSQNQV
jgi:hypothetical protein